MKWVNSTYLTLRFYALIFLCVLLFVLSHFLKQLFLPAIALLIVGGILFLLDVLLLYVVKEKFYARRICPARMANGNYNEIKIFLENRYPFKTRANIIDEIPHQFQKRDLNFTESFAAKESKNIAYNLRPTKRGEYSFGSLNIFIQTAIGLAQRRYKFNNEVTTFVYPDFLRMREYEIMAISNRLTEYGIKRIRKIGHSMAFEQIRNYVAGDDQRTVNWKATARTGQLMVNHYEDEKSQQVFCLIDKGRVMKMPFEELSLLDYAINATLVISNIVMMKEDKAGLITFSDKLGQVVPAQKKRVYINTILETLFNQKTRYLESDYEMLYASVRRLIKQRSLLILFTNFETLNGMRRQLPYLKSISSQHLLLVVFFENTELNTLIKKPSHATQEIYHQTIAEKLAYEKKQIVVELNRHGIHSLLTPPQNLNINVINRYLEFKARGII